MVPPSLLVNPPRSSTFTEPTGKVFTTEGKGKGKILWANLHVDTSVATVNKRASSPPKPQFTQAPVAPLW